MNSRRRAVIIAVSGAALLLALVLVRTNRSEASGTGHDVSARQLVTRRGDLVERMVLTGELDAGSGAAITVPALPQWQSAIKWIAADGTEVAEGEKVVELDNSSFSTDLEEKRRAVEQALQQLNQKKAETVADGSQKELELERKKTEFDKARIDASVPDSIVSRRELEDRQLRLRKAEMELMKARDVVSSAKRASAADRANLVLNLYKARREIAIATQAMDSLALKAPRRGIFVVGEHPWEGRKILSGDSVWVGFPLARIPEMSTLQVIAALADVDDGRISSGTPVRIVLDAYPDKTYAGQITDITPVAQEPARQSLRRSFRVKITLNQIDLQRMRPGLSAKVTVERPARRGVVLAPRASLDLSGAQAQLIDADGERIKVRVGACNAQECEILDGAGPDLRLGRVHG